MTSAIRRFMRICQPTREIKPKTLTRQLRKKIVIEVIGLLNNVLNSETEYRDAIPEQFTQRYETADHACEQFAEAIACLEEAF
ncbi:MAG: hypothetical protein FWH57_12705 [Oscillospiraceae bacterium]|nr:hypothetical protein [Oscillospiraceae bacterium]